MQRLIFDVGMHKGEDTAYYLARGFNVVAIEADPFLVQQCKDRFADDIANGRLEILHGAITDEDVTEITFYRNPKVSVWGTVLGDWAERNARLGADFESIVVPTIDFSDVISEFGCPYYLKIDIEGMDRVCLERLRETTCRPNFISIESEKVCFASLIYEFDLLRELGYSKFQIRQQSWSNAWKVSPSSLEGPFINYTFPKGSSGPFGLDLDGQWLDAKNAIATYAKIFHDYAIFGDQSVFRQVPGGRVLLHALSKLIGRPLPGWYDTHAKLAD